MTGLEDDDLSERVVEHRVVDEITADGFDDADLWYVYVPWYRTTPAIIAGGAMAAGLVLLVVSSVLLITHRGHDDRQEPIRWQAPSGLPPVAPESPTAPSTSETPPTSEVSAPPVDQPPANTHEVPSPTPEPLPPPTQRRGAIGGKEDGY